MERPVDIAIWGDFVENASVFHKNFFVENTVPADRRSALALSLENQSRFFQKVSSFVQHDKASIGILKRMSADVLHR